MGKTDFYMNDAQMKALFTNSNVLVVCAGRGTGKSVIQAERMKEVAQLMPRSTSAFVSSSAIRAMTNTLPSIIQHWERMGYHRDVHWCIGRRPPKKLGWQEPLIPPQNWEYVISWYTGAIICVISQDRAGTSNSFSFDHVFIDEAKFIDFEQLKSETMPANRGQINFFGDCFLHHGYTITGDMPTSREGSWFLRYEDICKEKENAERLEMIHALIYEQWKLRQRRDEEKDKLPEYVEKEYRRNERILSVLRKQTTFFGYFPSTENLQVLGEEFLRQQKRDLPYLTFYTTILCRKLSANREGFYACLKPRHKYKATNFNYLDGFGWDFKKIAANYNWRMDADLQLDVPLRIGFDYNAKINWLVVAQPDEMNHRCNIVKSMFVKYDQQLAQLLRKFDAYYKGFPVKRVVFYYDSTAKDGPYAYDKRKNFKWFITHTLKQLGWVVIEKYIGKPMNHLKKNALINNGFMGNNRLTPYFNEENNTDLLISIESAGVVNNKKDKSGEKLAESEEDRLENRTDGSDAFDTVYIGCENFPTRGGGIAVTSDFTR